MDSIRMALECCTHPDSVMQKCEQCDYPCSKADWVKIDRKLANDVLSMLKAQEPRVYTVDELKRGEHYYLELHLEPTGDGIHYAEISSIDRWHDKLHGKFKSYDLIYDERGASYMYEWSYGRTWRCWTSRPTDEQREAKPWNV